MADSSALGGLLSRAKRVFELAGELGGAFREEKLGQGAVGWQRHKPAFEQFCAAVLELGDAIKRPPDGFATVADRLREAAQIGSGIRVGVQTAATEGYPAYADFFPHLYSLAEDGRRTINEVTKAQRLDDPFARLDELANVEPDASEPDAEISALFDMAVELDEAAQHERIRQFWIQCGMPANLGYGQGQVWAREEQSRKDAAAEAWRAKVTRVERCIEARCRKRMLAAGFRDDEMRGTYLPCLPPFVADDDPRSNAFQAAMKKLKKDEQAKSRLFGCVSNNARFQDGHQQSVESELQTKATQRAKQQADAAERSRHEMVRLDSLEVAWERIYIAMPLVGNPVDYPRWEANIVAFADAAKDLDACELFLQASPATDDERNAVSLIHAAIMGGTEAVRKRLLELDHAEDDRGWKRVFNRNDLFWQVIQPKHVTSVPRSKRDDEQLGFPESAGDQTSAATTQRKQKRSTERGEGQAKIIAALTKHHKYADGSCLHLEPIGNNELARQAQVSTSTASTFFNNEFNAAQKGGHRKYCVICRHPGRLADALKALNGEFSPHELYGRLPPDEGELGDEG